MTNEQIEAYLERCASAFRVFETRNPDYQNSEAAARLMATELGAAKLEADNADHLEYIWSKIRPAAPAPVVEPADPLEAEALRLISSGEVTVEKVRALSSEEFERKSHNLAFCKALELIEKPALPQPSRGDVAIAYGRARRNGTELTAEIVRAVEESRNATASAYAGYLPPAERPAVNPHYSSPMSRTNAPAVQRRTKLTLEESRANEAANAQRTGRGMKSLSVHERSN
jgi:hypothetical protein